MPLDPEIEALLVRAAASGVKPRSEMTIAETREFAERGNGLSGEPVELARVYDAALAGVPVRFYEPAAAQPCTILYIHGGRFISGNLNSHDTLCRSLAAGSGCKVVAVDYRLAPEHRFPAALEDCLAVAKSIEGPLILCGDSAGGNLAAGVALEQRGRFLAQILIYPMLDASCSLESHVSCGTGYGPGSADMQRGWQEYGGKTNVRHPRLSPLWADDLAGLPPTLVLSAEYDSLRDEAEEFARRLSEAGVAVTLKRLEGAIHGIIQMAGVLVVARIANVFILAYIRNCLGETELTS